MTEPSVAHPHLPTVNNLRDVGGHAARDGRTVRRGAVYRSAALDKISDDDGRVLLDLGVRTIYDLRSAAEVDAAPDPRLDGVAGVHLDVLADAESISAPASLDKVLSDPETVAIANERLADGGGITALTASYRELVQLPSAQASYATLFRGLLDGSGAVLFHCTAGKDRTGWAAGAFLTLLGVERDAVYHDYLLTNDLFLPAIASVFDGFAAAGGNPDLLRPVLGVQEQYLDAAFATMATEFGTIDRYFADALGITVDQQEALRDKYLEG
ncbi:tyrosine-protein phosphatase [Gordonia sp. NPDC003424]